MGLNKGHTNNPNGRPAGKTNKVTAELRQKINEILNNNWHTVEADLKLLEPKDRLMFMERLLKYILPALPAINEKSEIDIDETRREYMKLFPEVPDEIMLS